MVLNKPFFFLPFTLSVFSQFSIVILSTNWWVVKPCLNEFVYLFENALWDKIQNLIKEIAGPQLSEWVVFWKFINWCFRTCFPKEILLDNAWFSRSGRDWFPFNRVAVLLICYTKCNRCQHSICGVTLLSHRVVDTSLCSGLEWIGPSCRLRSSRNVVWVAWSDPISQASGWWEGSGAEQKESGSQVAVVRFRFLSDFKLHSSSSPSGEEDLETWIDSHPANHVIDKADGADSRRRRM